MNRWEGDRAAWKCWLISNGRTEVRFLLEILWIRLPVTAEAFYFPLVSELALSVGSLCHLFFSRRQERGAEALSWVSALLGSGRDLLCRFCAGAAGCHRTRAVILGTDTVGSCSPKSRGSWSWRGERWEEPRPQAVINLADPSFQCFTGLVCSWPLIPVTRYA